METIRKHLDEAARILKEFSVQSNIEKIEAAAKIMADSIASGGKIISCGNGGSMSDAMHFAEEMTGRFRESRNPFPAIAVSDPAHLTCVANDYGFDHVFSRFVEAFGKPGDVLLAISTSGNSKNVINAIDSAQNAGMKIIGLTGKDGGKMATLCDVEIRAPKSEWSDRTQEIHIKVIHILIDLIEHKLLPHS